jgi:hypothetical protein
MTEKPNDFDEKARQRLDKEMEAELEEMLNVQYMITLQGDLRSDVPPKVVCGCGWEEGPDANLVNLGVAAKQHFEETGHILRPHDVER